MQRSVGSKCRIRWEHFQIFSRIRWERKDSLGVLWDSLGARDWDYYDQKYHPPWTFSAKHLFTDFIFQKKEKKKNGFEQKYRLFSKCLEKLILYFSLKIFFKKCEKFGIFEHKYGKNENETWNTRAWVFIFLRYYIAYVHVSLAFNFNLDRSIFQNDTVKLIII